MFGSQDCIKLYNIQLTHVGNQDGFMQYFPRNILKLKKALLLWWNIMLMRGGNYENCSPCSGYPIFVRVIQICTPHLLQVLRAPWRWRWGADSCKRIVRFFSPLTSPQMNLKWFAVRNRFHNFILRGGFCFRAVRETFVLCLENCIRDKEVHHRSIKIIFTRPPFN